jgi:uncharacterized protein YhaN
MIIKKLDITRFGRLEDKTLSFSDGFNVIYGTNESGKTTISAFIEAMLFGCKNRDAERKKYIPLGFQSSSGSITIEHDGESILLSRTIAQTAKGDSFSCFPSGAKLDFLPESKDTYRKSIYCRESQASEFGSTEEIEYRLSNIISTSDEVISAKKALSILSDAKKALKPRRGNGGKISLVESKLSELENERQKALEKEAKNRQIQALISNKEAALEELYKKHGEYKAKNEEIISLDSEISKLNEEISSQEDYIASFSEPDYLPSSPKAIPFLVATVLLFALSFILPSFAKLLFVVPILSFAIIYILYRRKLSALLSAFQCSSVNEYKDMLHDFTDAKAHYNSLLKEREDIISRRSNALSSASFEDLSGKMLQISADINDLKASLVHSMPVEDIDSALFYYRNERDELVKKFNAINGATSAIEYATERLSRDFTPKIAQKANEYLKIIAPNEKRELFLEKDFSVSLSNLPLSSCSFGLLQEIYISFRAALSDMLYGDDMPLIFDDPFLGSDDIREKTLIDIFNSISKNRQVIIFTNRLNPYFEQIGCNYIDITTENDV